AVPRCVIRGSCTLRLQSLSALRVLRAHVLLPYTPGHQKRCDMGLRDKYQYAIQTAKNVRMQGSADERDGKLYFHGTVNTQDEANQIWNAIKTVPDWQTDIVA